MAENTCDVELEQLEERLIEELDSRDEFGGCLIYWS